MENVGFHDEMYRISRLVSKEMNHMMRADSNQLHVSSIVLMDGSLSTTECELICKYIRKR